MDSSDELDHFSLKWNNYNDTMKTGFHDLLQREDFVDVTIAAEGRLIQAHKMVLSICSPYFKTIFKTNPCQHPVVFLKDVTHREISGILRFMYLGEVSITQEDLAGFLRTAEALQIKGLCSEDDDEEDFLSEENNAIEDEETKYKDEKKIKILPPHGGSNDRNSPKTSPLCNGDDVQIETIKLSSHETHSGDDDEEEEEEYDDDDDDEEEEEEEEEEYDDDENEMDINDHEGGEPKKMKMSSPDDGPSPIDPHVPVIKTPERPVINSNAQPSQVVKKDVRPQTDNKAFDCERASVVQEIDGKGDNNQGLDGREAFAENVINSLSTGNGSEVAQEVNNFQPVADLHTQGKSQQEIRFVVSQRRRLCLVFNNYLYIKDHVGVAMPGQPKTIYWRCKNVTCKARCIQTDFKFKLKRNTYHQHDPNADKTYLPIPMRQAFEMMNLFT